MATVRSIKCSLTAPFTGVIRPTQYHTTRTNLNCSPRTVGVVNSWKFTFSGIQWTELQDSGGRERYILNGQLANIDNFQMELTRLTTMLYNYLDTKQFCKPTINQQCYGFTIQ